MKLVYTFVFAFCFLAMNGQYNFEDWEDGNPELVAMQKSDIIGMKNSNLLFPFLGKSVLRSDDAYEGDYAARLISKKFRDEIFPASISTWVNDIDYINLNYKTKTASLPLEGGMVTIQLYYKSETENTTDFSAISCFIYDLNGNLKEEREYSLPAKKEWTSFKEVIFVPYENGDQLGLVIKGNTQSIDNDFFVDELNIKSEAPSNIINDNFSFKISPNIIQSGTPTTISISDDSNFKFNTLEIIDLGGRLINTVDIDESHATIPPLTNGMYWLKIGTFIRRIIVQ